MSAAPYTSSFAESCATSIAAPWPASCSDAVFISASDGLPLEDVLSLEQAASPASTTAAAALSVNQLRFISIPWRRKDWPAVLHRHRDGYVQGVLRCPATCDGRPSRLPASPRPATSRESP